jgi:hypothetical protein
MCDFRLYQVVISLVRVCLNQTKLCMLPEMSSGYVGRTGCVHGGQRTGGGKAGCDGSGHSGWGFRHEADSLTVKLTALWLDAQKKKRGTEYVPEVVWVLVRI